MSQPLNQLWNPNQAKPGRAGLAASPAQSVRGSTLSPWITAHAAVSSLALCLTSPVSRRPWPFMDQRGAEGETESQAERVSGAAAAYKLPPVGNTGGSFRSDLNV